jgi:hypothetical protein
MPGGADIPYGNVKLIMMLDLSVTFTTLGASASSITTTASVPGTLVNDFCLVSLNPAVAHLFIDNAYVSANGTVTFTISTDGTGVTGTTVPILMMVWRATNANLGLAAIPGAVV